MSSEPPTISVVVPAYFNEDSVPELVGRLTDVARETPDERFEFVFVDDGSGDGTFALLSAAAEEDDRVSVARLARNFGSNAAILAGLGYATGDAAVVISADLQDPPELIPELIHAWRDGAQVVLATRRKRHDPIQARFFAAVFNRLVRRFVFSDFPPGGFDFMLVDRRVIDILVGLQEKNSYIFGQTMWVGFERRVVPYDRAERRGGRSRWTTAKKIKYFIDAFAAFSYLPIRLASIAGFCLAASGFLYILVIVAIYFAGKVAIQGWASLTAIVLLTSGVQLILLGVMGEYLWRTLDESRQRPPFVIASLVNKEPVGRLPEWVQPPPTGSS